MEQKRLKWFLLQPEQRDEVSSKDKAVIGAMLALFVISVLIYKYAANETLALAVMSIVAAIGALDALYELKQPHVKAALRRYFAVGLGCVITFFALTFIITKQLLNL